MAIRPGTQSLGGPSGICPAPWPTPAIGDAPPAISPAEFGAVCVKSPVDRLQWEGTESASAARPARGRRDGRSVGEMTPTLLFAYGTLAPGGPEEAALDGWTADAVRGRLFDLGPYP